MSISKGPVAHHKHNVEEEYRRGLDNVEPTRTPLNEVLCDTPLRKMYDEVFGPALARYNARQVERGHPERQIADYYQKIIDSKQEKPCYEMVVQVGNRDSNPAWDEWCRDTSKMIYKDFLKRFREEFPALRVVQAVTHVDEATPHLHLQYVPVSTGNKRGLEVKNSLRGALREMGYEDVRDLSADAYELLEEVCHTYDIERVDGGCHGLTRQDVRDFKEQCKQADYPYHNDPRLVGLLEEQSKALEQASEVMDKQAAIIDEVCHTPVNPLTVNAMKQVQARALEQAALLNPPREALRGVVSACKAILAAIPRIWRDAVINPISDHLRASRAASFEREGARTVEDMARDAADAYRARGAEDAARAVTQRRWGDHEL